MNFNLPREIYDPYQLHSVLRELAQLTPTQKTDLAQASVDADIMQESLVRLGLSTDVQIILERNAGILREGGVQGIIEALEAIDAGTRAFELILPTHPTPQILERLIGWFRQEIHPYLLLKIKTKRALAGGFILVGKDKVYDYSFRKSIVAHKDDLVMAVRDV